MREIRLTTSPTFCAAADRRPIPGIGLDGALDGRPDDVGRLHDLAADLFDRVEQLVLRPSRRTRRRRPRSRKRWSPGAEPSLAWRAATSSCLPRLRRAGRVMLPRRWTCWGEWSRPKASILSTISCARIDARGVRAVTRGGHRAVCWIGWSSRSLTSARAICPDLVAAAIDLRSPPKYRRRRAWSHLRRVSRPGGRPRSRIAGIDTDERHQDRGGGGQENLPGDVLRGREEGRGRSRRCARIAACDELNLIDDSVDGHVGEAADREHHHDRNDFV